MVCLPSGRPLHVEGEHPRVHRLVLRFSELLRVARLEQGMHHLIHARMTLEVLCDFQRIRMMFFHPHLKMREDWNKSVFELGI